MLGDLLRLDIDAELFLEKSIDDLKFISFVMESLVKKLEANPDFPNRERDVDNMLDAELQFSRLLTKFVGDSGPFSASLSPEIMETLSGLMTQSSLRRETIGKFSVPLEDYHPESVVSHAELSGLLKGL